MKLFRTSNIETVHYCQTVFGCKLPSVLLVKKGMRNSLRNLHVLLFSCLVKLFYFSVLLLCFLATVMVNKDDY